VRRGHKYQDGENPYCVVFVQTMITNYRTKFFLHLVQEFRKCGLNLLIPTGTTYFYPELKNGYEGIPFVKLVKNVMLFSKRLMFQLLPLRSIVEADLIFFEFNPRILSTWLVVFVRRLLGRRSVGWGHYYSRKGEGFAQNLIRRLLFCLIDEFVTYSERDRNAIFQAWPNKKVLVAYNSTGLRSEFEPASPVVEQRDMVYSGRLIPEKKVDLLLRSFAIAREKNSKLGRLHIVGTGDEIQFLEGLAQELSIVEHVVFHGSVFEMDALRDIYESVFCSASPGYVGLMVFQSHAHGRPILVSPDEPNSPEFHMCLENVNSQFFESNSAESLAGCILDVFQKRGGREYVAREIQEACLGKYSIEAMVNPFVAFATSDQSTVSVDL
jgi:glycosyltransferase involved in cell wall biosynthesis